jgi:hypothetical protein
VEIGGSTSNLIDPLVSYQQALARQTTTIMIDDPKLIYNLHLWNINHKNHTI